MDTLVKNPVHYDQAHKGLTVRRQGECLEAVSLRSVNARLLSAHQQVEVVEINLKKDARLNLWPGDEATETYYVLAGQLSYPWLSGNRLISVGDYIVTQALEAPVTFLALTETRLLYITSQPNFHEISKDLGQLRALSVEVELKDGYTAEHCTRLQAFSYATGLELGLESSRLPLLDYGAYLHDVGKLVVPVEVLQKPTSLTACEWELIKRHPTAGREMLDKTFMKEAGKIVEQHHERLDGSGYPYGLSGNEVLIEAAIVAVADSYDAMTTDRPYRRAMSREQAFGEIRKYAGIHYPKEVVKAFFAAIKKVEKR